MITFGIILKLRDNDTDSESHNIMAVLGALSHDGKKRVLAGGGGYLDGCKTKENDGIVIFYMQKNDQETGDLVNVTNEDREYARRVLASHVNVIHFLVGPVESDGRTWEQMNRDEEALVAQFVREHQ